MLTNERLEVIRKYRGVCSEIVDGRLYLGGYQVACDWSKLQEKKITHIVNVSGDTCGNVFEDKLGYRTYHILDTPQESIEGALYDSIEWIDAKLKESSENRVYVHCQEGVSRSSSFVIGYLMWKYKKSFSDASDYVRERRGTSSPNIGFTYQLLLFQKALSFSKPGGLGVRGSELLPHVNHIGKKHWVTSMKLYYMSRHGIPASLINWKGDGSHSSFSLNSSKVYLLRQSLLEEADSVRRERLWIWIGSQVKEGLRESILGILRFCRQILEIEMGHSSSLELENLDIRTDLIIGALEDNRNSASEHLTNILSSTVILEYFHEFSESAEFMRILAPNSVHACTYDMVQRSFSSPSIKSVSRSAIPGDFESEDGGTEGAEERTDHSGSWAREPSSGSGSEMSSLVSLDESLSYFSSFPSSNGSPTPSRNSPSGARDGSGADSEEMEAVGRAASKHHFSLDSQQANYTRERLLGEGGEIGKGLGRVMIPKLNFAFKGEGFSDGQFREEKQRPLKTGTDSRTPSSLRSRNQRSIHFNQSEVFCYNCSSSNCYSKRSSRSRESSLSVSEECCSTLEGGGTKVLLFRFPDYFGSESLHFFDSEDLLPGSVCPLVIFGETVAEEDRDREKEQQAHLSTVLDKELKSVVIYLWIGSKTDYFSQAKKILSDHFRLDESHNSHVDVRPLLLKYDESPGLQDFPEKGAKTGGREDPTPINQFKLDIGQLLILLIRNNSKLSLKDIGSVYFEFEGQESNSFWNYFYL